MSLSIAIVGLPNVGKSTLFNALTKKSVLAANYPFATIDPSVGVVEVPDDRLWKLGELSKSKKIIPAAVEFVDIAGLVRGASEGQGLGNQFLSHIRETAAIVQIVRIFEDPDIIHVEGGINPKGDIETINLELILADLESVNKRLASIGREVKRGLKEALEEEKILLKFKAVLEGGGLASSVVLEENEKFVDKTLFLLTRKPIFYAFNKKTGAKNLNETNSEKFAETISYIEKMESKYVIIDAKIEEDMKEFSEEEKKEFSKELGNSNNGIDDLIKTGYEMLNLITFFTTGEDETRAWTIKRGTSAKDAGAAIHGDFRDKFVRAEIIFWESLLQAGSYASAREKGLVRTEGKEYIVKDGDVIEFKI